MRRRWSAVVLVACAVVVACGALLAVAARTALPADGAGRRTPPRALEAAELDVLHTAGELLVRDCMRAQGFSYWPVPRVPHPDWRDFPYGVDDVDWARSHGFGRRIERQLDEEAASGPRAQYQSGLSAQRLQALGVALMGPDATGLAVENPGGGTLSHSDRGCITASWRQLYGDVRLWYGSSETVKQLGAVRTGRVNQDPAFRTALAGWSECVGRRGFPAAHPVRQRDEQLARTGPAAEAEDVPMASAQAECARSTGLADTAQDLHRRFSDVIRAENGAAFDAVRRLQVAALPTARDVVARHTGS
ncbi:MULTISPECIES: hypothetical protein [unclassified Streptomyces]|uniref:hypothetical protein n=1 Tax=unclassified Streptomyces TaxID=2593676 RepID=UPI002E2A15A3|nr:hypothetical protein [Streptomyces sp. NBC_01439]